MAVLPLPSGVYGGDMGRRRIAGDMTLVESTYGSHASLARHRHERPYFCYVVRGAFHEQSAGGSRLSERGDLIFHPAGESHSNRFGDHGGVCFNIEVPPAFLAGLDSPELTQTTRAIQFRGGIAAQLADLAHGEFRREDRASDLIVEGLALALIGESCRAEPVRGRRRPPSWLSRALDILHDRFRESMTLGSIAAELDVHPVHFARTFRRHRGVTVGEYTRALRMEFACAELIAGPRTIADVAHASGFADHAHFCRSFRARFGVSPTRFRTLHSKR